MGIFLMALILVVCVLLALVVLVQNPKGGGLSSGFTGAGSFGGVQRTTDFLEKATQTLDLLREELPACCASHLDLNAAPTLPPT